MVPWSSFVYFGIVVVANDAWIYKTPIAKITHVKEEQTASRKAVRGGKELYYKQTMEARILNGTEKGQNIVLEKYIYLFDDYRTKVS